MITPRVYHAKLLPHSLSTVAAQAVLGHVLGTCSLPLDMEHVAGFCIYRGFLTKKYYNWIYFAKLNPSCNSNCTELTLLPYCAHLRGIYSSKLQIFFPGSWRKVQIFCPNFILRLNFFFFLRSKIRAQKHCKLGHTTNIDFILVLS